LVVSGNDFVPGYRPGFAPSTHVQVGKAAKKTVITGNILSGILHVDVDANHTGKVVVSNNADDS
jgi:hypothetical protein